MSWTKLCGPRAGISLLTGACVLTAVTLAIVAGCSATMPGVPGTGGGAALRDWSENYVPFDFLPPLNPPKSGLPPPTPGAQPTVEIYNGTEAAKGVLITRFLPSEININDGQFHVNWDTKDDVRGLPDGLDNCAIDVWCWGDQLGFVDCVIDKPGGKGKKRSDPDFFDLHDGRTLPIKFIIAGNAPGLSVTPDALNFGTVETSLAFTIDCSGDYPLTWTCTRNATWLSLSQAAGTGDVSVAASVTREGLPRGVYEDTAWVTPTCELIDPESVAVSMSVPNHAPVIESLTVEPTAVYTDAQANLTCVASDLDEDLLTYEWTCDGGTFSGSGSTAVWTAPPEDWDTTSPVMGTYALTCVVSDGGGGEDSETVQVEVKRRTGAAGITISQTQGGE